jgi:hypothetical protein
MMDMTLHKIITSQEKKQIKYFLIKGENKENMEIRLELGFMEEDPEFEEFNRLYSTITEKLKTLGKAKDLSINTAFGTINFRAKIRQ